MARRRRRALTLSGAQLADAIVARFLGAEGGRRARRVVVGLELRACLASAMSLLPSPTLHRFNRPLSEVDPPVLARAASTSSGRWR